MLLSTSVKGVVVKYPKLCNFGIFEFFKLRKNIYIHTYIYIYIYIVMVRLNIRIIGLGPLINLCVTLGIAHSERSQEKFVE